MQTKDILKELRKSKGYSNMKDFCDAIEISFNTYQNYETGKRTPTAEVLIKLADFYGVTTDYLLGREPAHNPFADLGLDTASEQEMLEQYMSFKPEIRALIMDTLIKLADAAKPENPSGIVETTTVGAELDRRAAVQDEAEAQDDGAA